MGEGVGELARAKNWVADGCAVAVAVGVVAYGLHDASSKANAITTKHHAAKVSKARPITRAASARASRFSLRSVAFMATSRGDC